jgi:hypothetical protein
MPGYKIDLDPVHTVIRLTVTDEIVTPQLAQEMYTRLQEISSTHGEYAAIYDPTLVKGTTIRGRSGQEHGAESSSCNQPGFSPS